MAAENSGIATGSWCSDSTSKATGHRAKLTLTISRNGLTRFETHMEWNARPGELWGNGKFANRHKVTFTMVRGPLKVTRVGNELYVYWEGAPPWKLIEGDPR